MVMNAAPAWAGLAWAGLVVVGPVVIGEGGPGVVHMGSASGSVGVGQEVSVVGGRVGELQKTWSASSS
ncbi:hypothetical protein Sya03_50200 [Spirilliplanes yamanashiensis]|uniref:Uncharacterized protein n=1 Tax=Spirilliplanes yamanashiensis TaxID=42233 RepID=A0A8J4DLR7_9ACTN|nr:hypothetical protein Sya03_50200 [Spirilliplanes yamanashiensis]